MDQVIRSAVENLFKQRMLSIRAAKHFAQRVIERNIPLEFIAYAMNRLADNICLVIYYVHLNGGQTTIMIGNYVFVIKMTMFGQIQIVTVLRPYINGKYDADLILE